MEQAVTQHAKVYITSAYDDIEPLDSALRAVNHDKVHKHSVTDDPASADIILFIENSRFHKDYFYQKLQSHPLVKSYPSKVFMYNPHDQPWFVLPGLYINMPKKLFNNNFIAASPFFEEINTYLYCDFSKTPEYLFSFNGNPQSCPSVRYKLLKLEHPRARLENCYTPNFGQHALPVKLGYADLMAASKFILCPRGSGTASFRLFEAMRVGRVPVIISDNWVPPTGPSWDDFAIRIAQKDIDKIPEILEREEANWEKKARLARQAWEDYFAPDTLFSYLIDQLLELKTLMQNGERPSVIGHRAKFLKYAFRRLIIQNVKGWPIYNRLKKNYYKVISRHFHLSR